MKARGLSALAAVVQLTMVGCKKDSEALSGSRFTSLLFDASSPAAQEALTTPVNFRLTESNYAQWEQAQRFLDALPRSALASAAGAHGNAIDRAVATLEASPRAETAIERTGLTVRDFVLETVALAQAAEARSGKSPGGVTVPPENIQFVQRYESRILQPRTVTRAAAARVDTYDEPDTLSAGGQSRDTTNIGDRDRARDSVGGAGHPPEQPKPSVDTARDTIPR